MRRVAVIGAFAAFACLPARPAQAQQVFESLGSRALGMGGAFVAVANDGTAAFWNPAGIALAPKGNLTIEWTGFHTGNQDQPPAPGPTTRSATFATFGSSNFNLSYASLQGADLVMTSAGTMAETLQTTQYGATVLQALAPGVIVGSTLKLVHGFAASEAVIATTGSNALSQVSSLQGQTVTRFDLDVGLMVDMKKVRLGFAAKNLEQPTFPEPGAAGFTIYRQARMGVAVLPTSGLTLAMDFDLGATDLRGGPREEIAIGGEDRIGKSFAFRSGLRWSMAGERGLVGSVGLSLAVKPGAWIDGHYTQGGIDGDRGFGLAFRVGS
jgi:hypothetical protein